MTGPIKRDLDRRMLRTLKAMARRRGEDHHAVTLPNWTNHDLRRVVRSGLSALPRPAQRRGSRACAQAARHRRHLRHARISGREARGAGGVGAAPCVHRQPEPARQGRQAARGGGDDRLSTSSPTPMRSGMRSRPSCAMSLASMPTRSSIGSRRHWHDSITGMQPLRDRIETRRLSIICDSAVNRHSPRRDELKRCAGRREHAGQHH